MATQFRVADATCGHCKTTIEQAVSALYGVTDVQLDLDSKLLRVQHDDSTSTEELVATIAAAGYTPEEAS